MIAAADRDSRSFAADLRYAGAVFLFSRAVFFLPVIAMRFAVGPLRPGPPSGHRYLHGADPPQGWFEELFLRWDAYWFLKVAREGYVYAGVTGQDAGPIQGPESSVAFFPLLPLLMRALSFGVLDPAVVGVVLCNVAFFIALVVLLRHFRESAPADVSRRAVLFFALFPPAIVYSSIYSDGVMVLLAAGSLLALQGERPVLSGVLAALAGASRLTGILAAAALLTECAVRARAGGRPLRHALVATSIAPLGLVAYFGWLWWFTGEPDAYFVSQLGCAKSFIAPWTGAWRVLRTAVAHPDWYSTTVNATFVVVAIGWTAAALTKVRPSHRMFWGAGLVMALSSTSLTGFPRYVGVLFPAFLPLAEFARTPMRHLTVLAGLTAASVLSALAWNNWYLSF